MTEQLEVSAAGSSAPTDDEDVLDRAPWESLAGHHARFALRHGRAMRYQLDVAPFVALEDFRDPQAWKDVVELLGPGERLVLPGATEWPDDWTLVHSAEGVQMVATSLESRPDPEAVRLGADDVPEMLDLVARTEPGPFLPRTVELGTYLGIRREGALVAMAGERLHPPGWTEISAVCTDSGFRGQGLASRLVRAVAAGIVARGERPFLHAIGTNANAIRLYESMGFELRSTTMITVLEHA
jgi:ribosomal protein S18 acetylase RimI-like enzyme